MPNVTIDLTQIVVALIGLLSALVTYRLIPWIKANTTVKQQAIIKAAVQTAVFAAEQIYGAGEGDKKFNYVIEWLHNRGFDVDIADVEATVYELLNYEGLVLTAPAKIDEIKVDTAGE